MKLQKANGALMAAAAEAQKRVLEQQNAFEKEIEAMNHEKRERLTELANMRDPVHNFTNQLGGKMQELLAMKLQQTINEANEANGALITAAADAQRALEQEIEAMNQEKRERLTELANTRDPVMHTFTNQLVTKLQPYDSISSTVFSSNKRRKTGNKRKAPDG